MKIKVFLLTDISYLSYIPYIRHLLTFTYIHDLLTYEKLQRCLSIIAGYFFLFCSRRFYLYHLCNFSYPEPEPLDTTPVDMPPMIWIDPCYYGVLEGMPGRRIGTNFRRGRSALLGDCWRDTHRAVRR